MPGLMDPYLADIYAAFQPNPGAPNYQPNPVPPPPPGAAPEAPSRAVLGNTPPVPPEQMSVLGRAGHDVANLISPPTPIDMGELDPPPPPVAPVPVDMGEVDDTKVDAAAAPAGPPPPPAIGPDPHAFDLQAAQGGGAPAHEQETRGPSVLAAQGQRNAVTEGAIGTIADRNQEAADREYQLAVSQERTARVREEAYQQSLAEQEDELAARQADFDSTSRQLSKLGQLNPDRLWASKSTAQKIAGGIEIMLAGFRGAPSAVQKRIDDDVKAQEFAYQAARSNADLKQSAFSTAMARYQNVNAARAMAKAAGIDVLQAQLAQVAAKNKGNETGNRAIAAMADLENERMMQIQQGIRFMPAQAGQMYFRNPRTGVVYNNHEAQIYDAKQQEYAQQDRTKSFDLSADVYKQHDKAALEASPDGSPLTKEQRGKMEMERIERSQSAKAFNEQIDYAKTLPELKQLGLGLSAREKLGPRAAPGAAKTSQTIQTLNSQILNALGKIAKDNEGKPGVAMLDEYRHTFNIPLDSTPELAQQKLEDARSTVNAFYRQQGIDVQRPNGQVATPEEIGSLEKSTSLRVPKK